MLSSKFPKAPIPWGLLLIEAVLVVLSVLLALGLNSWRENRLNTELSHRALNSIATEFSANCSRIQNILPYHREVANENEQPNGLQIGLIRNDAWESARSTGAAAHIDYETASLIGQIYASQRDHRTLFQSYIEALFSDISNTGVIEEIHGTLDIVVIRELVRIQERLLELYSHLEETVHREYGSDFGERFSCSGKDR